MRRYMIIELYIIIIKWEEIYDNWIILYNNKMRRYMIIELFVKIIK